VVGGGTAGNAVATRLSQYLPNSSILIIEAGPYAPDENRINIPGMKGSTLGTKYDWNFTSIPQAALNNRTITQSRGKVLGGSSALNLLIWDRASKPEYDLWEKVGNPGWNWNSMIAAMNKAENFTNPGPPIYTGTTGYGVGGPINAVVNKYIPKQQDPWVPTLEGLNVNHNTYWLGGENVGVAYHSSAIDPAHYNRSYSAVEYLPRAGPNLQVMTGTEVAKLNLEKRGHSYAVTGVTLLSGEVIDARKEVIASGGTIKNPQLLELSGIGSSAVLQAAGVKQIIDLPGVGENLQDHPRIQASYQLKDNYTSFDKLKVDPAYAAEQLALWQAGQYSAYDYAASAYSYQGWPSILGNDSARLVTAAKRVAARMNSTIDNAKLELLANPKHVNSVAQVEFVLSDGYTGGKGYPKNTTDLYGKGFQTIIAGLMHQLARGSVHINSSDASAHPVYDPNFASNEYDLQGIVAMAKQIRKIATTAPFSETWSSEYEPGLDVVQTDEEWLAYVRNNTNTFYHPVGSCAMLPRKDGGVVDSSLKVYSTHNLRVVDASVIPVLVSAHPQTGIYGIAERAAEIIAASWR
jgi:choline dehydrogenase-like flavoprotein